jgi:chromosome segregation ATPase
MSPNAFPAAKYLSELLTSHEFKKAYRDYRDLNYLQVQISKWNEKIPLLRTMLEERRRHYTTNATEVTGSHYVERLSRLAAKRTKLANEIADIENHGKAEQLATPKERERLAQLKEIKSRLDGVASRGLNIDTEIKDYRILYGLTLWKIHTDYPTRLWKINKGLHQLDKSLTQATQAQSSMENVLKITPLNFDGFSQRIVELDRHLTRISEKLAAATETQVQYCSQLIIDTLSGKRRQVDLQRNRALYAQARLYDQLSHEADAP